MARWHTHNRRRAKVLLGPTSFDLFERRFFRVMASNIGTDIEILTGKAPEGASTAPWPSAARMAAETRPWLTDPLGRSYIDPRKDA